MATSDFSEAASRRGPKRSYADVTRVAGKAPSMSELAREQRYGHGDVAEIYQSVLMDEEISPSRLEEASGELRSLHQRRPSMRIREDHILELRVAGQGREKWVAICPSAFRSAMTWQVHAQAHSGYRRTLSRLQLNWYWPRMVEDVRRLVGTCEVCQTAKQGGLKKPQGRQHLYAGRPWQKVAIDLVGPCP